MATRQWAVTTNGTDDFNSPADWTFGVEPGPADIAQFNTGAIDTVTGNATIAEILSTKGTYTLTGSYTISGAQPTELSVTNSGPSVSYLTIAPGASINGNQAVSVNGASGTSLLEIQGGLAASSLAISNSGTVYVDHGSIFDVTGPISIINNGALISHLALVSQKPRCTFSYEKSGLGQPPGAPTAISNAIQISGNADLGGYGKQEVDFNGTVSGSGVLVVIGDGQGGTVALNGNNTYTGGTVLFAINETLAVGNPNALGTATLTLASGELLATTTETIANPLQMTPAFTIAAAHGQTLTIGTGGWTFTPNNGAAITFGAPGQDGTVVFTNGAIGTINPGTYTVAVQAGTLRDGNGAVAFLDHLASNVLVQSGATLDVDGFSDTLTGLQGGGRITNSGASTSLTIVTTDFFGFSGVIDGALSVAITSVVRLSGNDTYTGGTTIANGGFLLLGDNGTTGSVAGTIVDNSRLGINRSDAITLNNVSGAGGLSQLGTGTTTLGSGLNYTGGTTIAAGTLAVANPAALGSGNLLLSGGELLGTATETISSPNTITIQGNSGSILAAAHGTTLTINPANLTFDASSISFGAAGQDGIVTFKQGANPASVSNPGGYSVTIQAGTLKALDNDTNILLGNDTATSVQAGATLDLAGLSLTVVGLQGSGHVTNSGAGTPPLTVAGGNFGGVIDGPLALFVLSSLTLTGADTYIGGTTITGGSTLTLGANGTAGSVTGTIADNGALAIDRSDTFALNNVSGSGAVVQEGSGTTILGSGLNYTGGTTIAAGTLSVGNPVALGAGGLTIAGGELLASATETIGNQLTMSGNLTIAAAHNQTLTLSSSKVWTLNTTPGETVSFGAAGQDGIVVFDDTSGTNISTAGLYTVTVQAGTLKAGDFGLSFLLSNDAATIVQSGATLDAAGFNQIANGLQGGGHITNTGAANTFLVGGGDFSGVIDGPSALSITGALSLTAVNAYSGGTTINGGAELTLGNGGATGSVTGNITDNGTLEFRLNSTSVQSGIISGNGNLVQDGTGITVLTAANSYSGGTLLGGGTLELQKPNSAGSGAITFLNGTASTLEIDGTAMPSNAISSFALGDTIDLPNVVATSESYSGGVLTLKNGASTVAQLNLATPYAHPVFGLIADGAGGTLIDLEPPPPADFNGDGMSDLQFQNTNGSVAIWEMNGTTPIFETVVQAVPPDWRLG